MSLPRHLLRRGAPPSLNPYIHLRRQFSSTTTTTNATHHKDHQRTHEFVQPSNYLNSWETPRNPKEAESRLAFLRRDYAKQVKAVRKEYIREMEFKKLEKIKKDETRREALRIANEERKAVKVAEKIAKAKERQIAQEEFRKTLMKERAGKLEYWRTRTKQFEEKKAAKNEVLRRQSSFWINEAELEKKILEYYIDTVSL